MKSLLRNNRRADVVFYRGGKITLSSYVVHALGISAGDVIDVSYDGSDYFLHVSHRAADIQGLRYEATCYPAKHNVAHLRANSVRLCNKILSICRLSDRAALPVGDIVERDGHKLITLLTCIPINR